MVKIDFLISPAYSVPPMSTVARAKLRTMNDRRSGCRPMLRDRVEAAARAITVNSGTIAGELGVPVRGG